MSHERSNTSSSGGPAKADDLKLINGIGPAVEKRLNDVGIFTFAQLAALSPADIAAAVTGISGLASERIIKQDWIGQAHKLAAQSSGSEPDWIEQARQLAVDVPVSRRKDDAELPGETQRSTRATSEQQEKTKTPLDSPRHATFTVELLLSADDEALSTHITHRESGDEKIWDSWPHVELLSFFVQHAQLNQLQQGSWPSGTEELASASPIPEDSEGTVAPTEENETALTGAESSGDIIASTEEATAPIAENNEGVIASKEENEITLPDMEDSRGCRCSHEREGSCSPRSRGNTRACYRTIASYECATRARTESRSTGYCLPSQYPPFAAAIRCAAHRGLDWPGRTERRLT